MKDISVFFSLVKRENSLMSAVDNVTVKFCDLLVEEMLYICRMLCIICTIS